MSLSVGGSENTAQIAALLGQFTFDSVRNKALICMDEPHAFIHPNANGAYYVCSTPVSRIDAGSPYYFYIPPYAQSAHMSVMAIAREINPMGHTILKIYENPRVSYETLLPIFDRNRPRAQSPLREIYTVTSIDDVGTLIYEEMATYTHTEHKHDKFEFILGSVGYLIELGHYISEEQSYGQVIFNWYENY